MLGVLKVAAKTVCFIFSTPDKILTPESRASQHRSLSRVVCLMDSKKSNKIREVVRLQQILKKWKKVAAASSNSSASSSASSKGIKFLKRTLSFTDVSSSNNDIVPKGFLAVCVGKELKRFVIPTDYLRHEAFEMLLQEAEEEFGFQQEGVLKIPCQVSVFEKILKAVEDNKEALALHEFGSNGEKKKKKDKISCYASDCEVTPPHHAQTCT
ncbi:Auxin-responsive protein SAUR72 [Spatholobus suberectus]|nr:Auxin-responsive protein SAUR72 [Spatholobus suberectus]